jgi:S-adenosylmethionine-dependent methyltransferase
VAATLFLTARQLGELRLVQGVLADLGAADSADSADLSAISVLDCGGGTGRLAVPMAQLGARVTVVDISADALATLASRASEAGVAERVTAVQGDLEDLGAAIGAAQFDLALVHGVLDAVDPRPALAAVYAGLRPGGLASVLIANPAAVVLAKVLAGDLDAAVADLRYETETALDATTLAELCRDVGFSVDRVSGVGVFADLIPAAALDAGHSTAALELEALSRDRSPYREIATRLHVLARRGPTR